MELAPLQAGGRQLIQGYGKGGFRIADVVWRGPVLVVGDRTVAWPVKDIAAISPSSFNALQGAAEPVELILIGSGARIAMLPPGLRKELRSLGYNVEIMDTGAACRTYNILAAEERRVAAALLPIG